MRQTTNPRPFYAFCIWRTPAAFILAFLYLMIGLSLKTVSPTLRTLDVFMPFLLIMTLIVAYGSWALITTHARTTQVAAELASWERWARLGKEVASDSCDMFRNTSLIASGLLVGLLFVFLQDHLLRPGTFPAIATGFFYLSGVLTGMIAGTGTWTACASVAMLTSVLTSGKLELFPLAPSRSVGVRVLSHLMLRNAFIFATVVVPFVVAFIVFSTSPQLEARLRTRPGDVRAVALILLVFLLVAAAYAVVPQALIARITKRNREYWQNEWQHLLQERFLDNGGLGRAGQNMEVFSALVQAEASVSDSRILPSAVRLSVGPIAVLLPSIIAVTVKAFQLETAAQTLWDRFWLFGTH